MGFGGGWGESEGLVEITSMNHGFAVDGETLPDSVEQTHRGFAAIDARDPLEIELHQPDV